MTADTTSADEPAGVSAVRSAAVTQAMEWFTRHRAGELSAAQKHAFMEWLRASPLHVGEYLAAARLAEDLPEVAARLRAEQPGLLERVRAPDGTNIVEFAAAAIGAPVGTPGRRFRGRGRIAAAAVVLLSVLTGALIWAFATPGLIGLPRAIEVAHGEQRTLQLRDGSVAHLNTDTRIKVRYSQSQRLIEFEGGQALFQVARDSTRPFRVRAGSTEVLAVGTQFELYRNPRGALTVTVVEGKVDVRHEPGLRAADAASGRRPTPDEASGQDREDVGPVRLAAGEQIRFDEAGEEPRAVAVDLRVATAWVQREVVFNQQPLNEVAAEFGRYSSIPIVIDDPALRELRVSGIFKAYDTDSFVGFLQQFEGVEVRRSPQVIRIQRRK